MKRKRQIELFNIIILTIFVIFFTLTFFELWKFYTQKVLNFMSKLPRDKTMSVKFTHSLTECFDTYKVPNYV